MEEDIARLYEECYSIMVAYLMHVYRFMQDDAQEIASQAILEEISPGGSKFDPSRGVPLTVWMVRKVSFRAKDELRKRKQRKAYTHIDAADLSIEGKPEIETPQARNRRKLVGELPKELRVIFELTSHEYTAEEIAAMLEMKLMRVRYLQRKLKIEVVRVAKELGFTPEDLFDEE